MTNPYEDIIHLPHPVSATHPHMSALDRAAQFSPFAALTGYEAAVKETARLTDKQIELDENAKAALEAKLRILLDELSNHPQVKITYFQADEKKHGGSYVDTLGSIKKLDEYERILLMMDGTKIPIDAIVELESELFQSL